MKGFIKKLNTERGFGFITGQDGVDRFFHRSVVAGSFHDLDEGQDVEFEEDTSPRSLKGPRAARVAATEGAVR